MSFGIVLVSAHAVTGRAIPDPTVMSAPDLLTIVRQPPSAHAEISDPAMVQRLYALLLELPPVPAGTFHCPRDSGVTYSLVFYDGSTVVLPAIVHPSGCQTVLLGNGQSRWALGAAGSAFLDVLRAATGLSVTAFSGS